MFFARRPFRQRCHHPTPSLPPPPIRSHPSQHQQPTNLTKQTTNQPTNQPTNTNNNQVKYPENFFLLRGNHECASINRIYGFYDECKRRYNIRLWRTFTDCFNCLPVAALIDEKILCMHGGLSPELKSLDQIKRVARPTDVPDSGLLCDLLWADPDKDIHGWGENDRGVSYTFGPDCVTDFLNRHDLDLVCRAHQVVEEGYEFFARRQLVTIFSAPNYCGEFENAGAMMSVDETLMCSFQILKPAEKKAKALGGGGY